MKEKRRSLGRGIGALIPDSQSEKESPIDVFFSSASVNSAKKEKRAEKVGASITTDSFIKKEDKGVPQKSFGGEKNIAKKRAVKNVSRETQKEKEELVPVPGATYGEIPVEQIIPNTKQPRQIFDEDELEELSLSIKEVGVLQPIVVRPLPKKDSQHPQARYELIMGERRWRATKKAGIESIPAVVRRTEDADLLRDALLENLHRAQLNPLEEAAAYQQLLDDFDCTQEELAKRIAKSRPQISNTLRLLKLPPLVQRRVAAGVLSAGHARALLGLSDPATMERLAQQIVAEGLSVRATEEIVTLSDDKKQKSVKRRRVENDPEIDAWAQSLGDYLDTRVKITQGIKKGKMVVEFASIEDLQRIMKIMGADS